MLFVCDEQVNCVSSGKTALQVSSFKGHIDTVKVLVDAGAQLWIQDAKGDAALHYAVSGYSH